MKVIEISYWRFQKCLDERSLPFKREISFRVIEIPARSRRP